MIVSLILFTIATITDFLDGYVARKYNQISRFGAFWDPLVDKLLILSVFVILAHKEVIFLPFMFVLILSLREYFITLLRIKVKKAAVLYAEVRAFKTSMPAKMKTVFQLATIYICYTVLFLEIYVQTKTGILNTVKYIPFGFFLLSLLFSLLSGWQYAKMYPAFSLRVFIKSGMMFIVIAVVYYLLKMLF